ncbi:MAG TPA: oxidoreductase [Jatrophihabitantaceae bacterium]|nr:oxidoreductase [Jatrophihabitantaceae bacterium]
MRDVGPILLTGCSSGIGAATARRLAERGYTVYATARRPDTLTDLASAGCKTLALDVTDEVSMAAAVDTVLAEHGRVGALVNNAGYGEYGAVEEVSIDRVRKQFETNVFGLARMCQLVLPSMRAAGTGRIVNIGSMGGRLTFPYGGYYHATKHAVEALSDALRYEVRPYGIKVVLFEPGLIATEFGNTVSGTMHDTTAGDSPYAARATRMDGMINRMYANRLLRIGPDRVAKVIEKALTKRSPHTRYVVPMSTRTLIGVRQVLPGRGWDGMLRTIVR